MQEELAVEQPDLDIKILGINENGLDFANEDMANGRDLPWLQDVDADDDGNSDVWTAWEIEFRDVLILDSQNRPLIAYNVTVHDLEVQDNYAELKQLFIDAALAEVESPVWTNPTTTLDVNDDTFISPLDALLVINILNTDGAHELIDGVDPTGPPYVDCNSDGFVSPIDALLVLNHLNELSLQNGAVAATAAANESDTLQASAIASAIDAAFGDDDEKLMGDDEMIRV